MFHFQFELCCFFKKNSLLHGKKTLLKKTLFLNSAVFPKGTPTFFLTLFKSFCLWRGRCTQIVVFISYSPFVGINCTACFSCYRVDDVCLRSVLDSPGITYKIGVPFSFVSLHWNKVCLDLHWRRKRFHRRQQVI